MVAKWISISLILATMVTSLSASSVAAGDVRTGAFTFNLNGYSIMGYLNDGVITHEGNVEMQMSINETIPISLGSVKVTGVGVWSGSTNFATLDGSIGNVNGQLQACMLVACQTQEFTGSGTWTGTLTWSEAYGSQAYGTFAGTIDLNGTNATQEAQVPVSGNWTATFLI
jgi:hypothetical protein